MSDDLIVFLGAPGCGTLLIAAAAVFARIGENRRRENYDRRFWDSWRQD